MPKQQYKRRKRLIDAKFQIPVAITMAATGLVMMAYHLTVVYFIVSGSRAGMLFQTRSWLTMVPLVLLLVIALWWLGVQVSHRIVGPAYRLRQTMADYREGKFETRAHLRKGDALGDVADALNALGERCESQEKTLAEFAAAADAASDSELRGLVKGLLSDLDVEPAAAADDAPAESSDDDDAAESDAKE